MTERVDKAVGHITDAARDACKILEDAYLADLNEAADKYTALETEFNEYKASHPDTPTQPEPPKPTNLKICGMSAPKALWDQRVKEVGKSGITARRIFADLNSSGSDQMDLVKASHDAGMMPIFSFKVPNITTALAGGYDAWVKAMVAKHVAFGKLTTISFWHEPHGDMTPKQFTDLNERYASLIQVNALIRFGPLLNGWLLDRRVADFKSYMTQSLFDKWDWVGIDTYQKEAGSPVYPGHRIKPLLRVMSDFGDANKPIAIGEYNGFDVAAISESGETFMSTPSLWFFSMWNSQGSGTMGTPLEGARLAAFKATKADPRVRQ